MTRIGPIICIPLLATLAACGGPSGPNARVAYATGPVKSACEQAGRNAASDRLCGCVQAVADRTLGRRDQQRAARFFDDPQEAQVVRQSDRRGDEAYWRRYRTFVTAAELRCN